MTWRAAPFRFLFGVVLLWCGSRAAYSLWPVTPEVAPDKILSAKRKSAPSIFAMRDDAEHEGKKLPLAALVPSRLAPRRYLRVNPTAHAPVATEQAPVQELPGAGSPHAELASGVLEQSSIPAGPPVFALIIPTAPQTQSRWSGSTWLFERGGRASRGLAAGGQLGGAQLGARAALRVTDDASRIRFDVAARAVRALRGPGDAEAAVGAELYPFRDVPLRLSVERRIAIGRGGRDAWAGSIVGGFYRGGLPTGVEADGYAQAGIVGARSRDGFVDAALRVAWPVRLGGGARLLLGSGIWGAAQPGVARLDLGPRAALVIPVAGAVATIAIEGRLRAAGDARPGSGIALIAGVDF